jgi:hypothetical protein
MTKEEVEEKPQEEKKTRRPKGKRKKELPSHSPLQIQTLFIE